MKTLKITLLLALFLTVSSQTEKAPSQTKTESNKYEQSKTQFDLLAHSRNGIRIPTQG
ncbi:hypothetical protein [Gelidibacter japonicus]|jgi:hypothetical protein|uniref:hypothetical protein n=1 Tax=Gelidibacter japonicus TaxID=1962232 RepID=UPI0013D38124|nr:hypothetical protein [Gelidibacter japonicus]MCL8007201.1 hypothetical protein [Gelidibacter japonicus]